MINYLLIAILIGACSFVYTNLLMEPDQIFGGLYRKAYFYFKSDEKNEQGKPYHPLFKIFFQCERCNAGQIALWFYLCKNFHNQITIDEVLIGIVFILHSILFASVIRGIYNKIIS